jgi:hypothetical protein
MEVKRRDRIGMEVGRDGNGMEVDGWARDRMEFEE